MLSSCRRSTSFAVQSDGRWSHSLSSRFVLPNRHPLRQTGDDLLETLSSCRSRFIEEGYPVVPYGVAAVGADDDEVGTLKTFENARPTSPSRTTRHVLRKASVSLW
jgi:hypothetical protein